MIRPLIRRLALAALDCGPSTLRHALEGDAAARRVLASLGVTPYDLTAIADARAADAAACAAACAAYATERTLQAQDLEELLAALRLEVLDG